MNRLLILGLCAASLMAASPKEVFETNCASCHITQNPTPDMRAKLVAPPASGVMWHIKREFPSKAKALAFMRDYVANPSKAKAICPSVRRFGLMPNLGLDAKTIDIATEYMYDHFPDPSYRHPKMGRGMGMGMGHGMGGM
ncbi:hypothetical protein [Hydrogenimonas sp.]